MADPFVAEIRILPFNFAPKGWAQCNGQLMPIAQNTALFSLLGTTYGGDGRSTFALPDLQSRIPIAPGQGAGLSLYDLGQTGGEATVTLLQSEIPSHTHALSASTGAATTADPTNAYWATPDRFGRAQPKPFATGAASTTLGATAVGVTGGTTPHENMPPYLTLNFCIALQGIFPPRS